MNAFSTFHPLLLIAYLVVVIGIITTTLHPIIIGLAVIGAISYFCALKGFIQTVKELVYYSFFALLILLSYSTFVHNGYTPLFFLNDQPITEQAVIKGFLIAMAVVAVCFYMKCYFEMFTTTKILYATSKLSSKIGIFVSMTFRFIPLFKESVKERQQAMKAIGYFTVPSKFDIAVRYVKLVIQTFILTAELVFFKPQVMTARGYGRKKRTQYAIIRYRQKDTPFLVLLGIVAGVFILFYGAYRYYYFPILKDPSLSFLQIGIIAIFMLFPTFYEIKENAKWHYLTSNI